MQLRLATAGDAATLAELNGHVHAIHVEAEPRYYGPTQVEPLTRWFAERLGRPEWIANIAELEGRAVGYVLLRLERRPAQVYGPALERAILDQIAVEPSARRRGVGRALVESAPDIARSRGISEIELEVRAFNTVAQRFFEALGYELIAHRMLRRAESAS